MDEVLIFLGETTAQNLRDRMPEFLSNQEMFGMGCHVADNLWAARTRAPRQTVFDTLVSFLNDPSLRIVVAPINGDWITQNCTPAVQCFRRD